MTKKVITEEMKEAWNDFMAPPHNSVQPLPILMGGENTKFNNDYIILIVNNKKSKYGLDIKLECLIDGNKSRVVSIDEIINKNNKLLNNIIKSHKGDKISVIPSNIIQQCVYLDSNIYDNITGILNTMKMVSVSSLFFKTRDNLTKALYEKNKSKNNARVPLVELMLSPCLDSILSNDRFKEIYDSIDKYILSTSDIKNLITQFYEKELEFINSENFNGIL